MVQQLAHFVEPAAQQPQVDHHARDGIALPASHTSAWYVWPWIRRLPATSMSRFSVCAASKKKRWLMVNRI
jgi:hypothetical protein